MIRCDVKLTALALPGVPLVGRGDDVAKLAHEALSRAEVQLQDGDVLVVTSKIVSRAEDRFVALPSVTPSPRALEVAAVVGKDPRIIELVLEESHSISRLKKEVLVTRHRLGFVVANAGIDCSNAVPPDAPPESGPWALLLPRDPDASAARIRGQLSRERKIGVVISDSFGRPFRLGTVGVAVGCSGVPPLWDRRGERDLHGRALEHTITALADQLAAVADLVAGQAAEGTPLVLIRGLDFAASDKPASMLCRPADEDLYA